MKFTLDHVKANPLIYVGLGGVGRKESSLARFWQRLFNLAGVLIGILMMLQWELLHFGQLSIDQNFLINIIVEVFFVAQFAVLISLVKDKKTFSLRNWALILIIVLGVLVLFSHPVHFVRWLEACRPVVGILIILPSLRLLIHFFADGKLGTTLFAAAVIVLVFGLLVAGIDPSVHSPWDGIWWAIATVSTVGYGDVVPTSPLGRLLGVFLVVLGLGIFSVITANFLALILRRKVQGIEDEGREVKAIFRGLVRMMDDQKEVKHMLSEMSNRIKQLEEKPSSKSSAPKKPASKTQKKTR